MSGFLGAGKTTFIRELSQRTKTEFAVMENEYGEAGIDGDILKNDRLKVWELTDGCICCSLKSDFASSILTIANTVNPEYLIVEPTGIGMLSSVISNIAKIEYDRIRLLEPVTVIDINCIDEYLKVFNEIYTDQIKNAFYLILSKTEGKTKEETERACAVLGNINPAAKIILEPYSGKYDELMRSLLHSFYTKSNIKIENPVQTELPDLENITLRGISIHSVEELMGKLVTVLHKHFGIVYRAKGYVPINGQWARFDIVNTEYNIETCSPMPEAKAVFIGKALKKEELKEFLTPKDYI
ncbi:cobalamin synthesis protein P47K [Treponema pedis str. T A4]|uniref:Cobalamin synthesis protein P47K n=1 Tax=Treponema pedis str. T A4 TaxID=1291379 RepID=S6A384_9SPIR|nr:cobalamin synthesis protein P47K [Treponema pedis str. T A4]